MLFKERNSDLRNGGNEQRQPGFELRWSTTTTGFRVGKRERARELVEHGGDCRGGGVGGGGGRERAKTGGWRRMEVEMMQRV